MCRAECKGPDMAASPSLDPKRLDKVLEVGGGKTKNAAVTRALVKFIARREQKRLRDLFGRFEWNPDFDTMAERSRNCSRGSRGRPPRGAS